MGSHSQEPLDTGSLLVNHGGAEWCSAVGDPAGRRRHSGQASPPEGWTTFALGCDPISTARCRASGAGEDGRVSWSGPGRRRGWTACGEEFGRAAPSSGGVVVGRGSMPTGKREFLRMRGRQQDGAFSGHQRSLTSTPWTGNLRCTCGWAPSAVFAGRRGICCRAALMARPAPSALAQPGALPRTCPRSPSRPPAEATDYRVVDSGRPFPGGRVAERTPRHVLLEHYLSGAEAVVPTRRNG